MSTRTCKIQWIDAHGNPTPDSNPAIGECWVVEHVHQIAGRGVRLPESERYPICHEHARQLDAPGMHHWRFERYTLADLFERFADTSWRLTEHYFYHTIALAMLDVEPHHFSRSLTWMTMNRTVQEYRAQGGRP